MNKSAFILIAAVGSLTLGSCSKLFDKHGKHHGKKEHTPAIVSEKTMNVTPGQVFTIALPTENTDDAYSVTTQSTIATSSLVEGTNYIYTAPAVLPIGISTDEVVVSNDHHAELNGIAPGGCIPGGSQNGNNNHDDDDKDDDDNKGADTHYTVKIHINYAIAKTDVDVNIAKKP